MIIPALLGALALTVVTALLVVAVSEAVLGRRMAPGPLWRRVRRRIPAVLGVARLLGLAFTVIAGPGHGPGRRTGPRRPGRRRRHGRGPRLRGKFTCSSGPST